MVVSWTDSEGNEVTRFEDEPGDGALLQHREEVPWALARDEHIEPATVNRRLIWILGLLASLAAGLLLAFRVVRRLRREENHEHAITREDPPPAPVAGGHAALHVRVAISALLNLVTIVRPLTFRLVRRQTNGEREAATRAVSSPAEHHQETRYRLPVGDPTTGEWYVANGGTTKATSHSWEVVSQRYAYDLVVVGEGSLERWRTGTTGGGKEDYLCYGEPVVAPADGIVVEVRGGLPDAPRPGTGWIDPFAEDFRGNHVAIEHAEDEYSFLAHLAPGSVRVRVGERVARGQEVGRCGNSGHSTEPHLHFQVQDRADFFKAAGLPVAFDGVSVDGGPPADGVYLFRGTRVRQD